MYLTGTVGGLMTTLGLQLKNAKGEQLPKDSWEMTEEYSRLLAAAADKALKLAKPVNSRPSRHTARRYTSSRTNPLYKIAWSGGVLERTFYVWTNDPYPDQARGIRQIQPSRGRFAPKSAT